MYYRFALLANPSDGSASFSWRVKCALENLGHTVFWFTPQRHPFLFGEGSRAVNLDLLEKFLGRQKPDALLTADGIELTDAQMRHMGKLCGTTIVGDLADLDLPVIVDETYLRTPLANTIAYSPRIICLQDATEARVAALKELEPLCKESGLVIRCKGKGWPKGWRIDTKGWNWLVYTSRAAVAQIVFEDEGDAPDANLVVLTRADGAPVIAVPLAQEAGPTSIEEAGELLRGIIADGLPLESRRFATNTDADAPTLENSLSVALADLSRQAEAQGVMKGCEVPRTIISILGYFGMGNYGDELILATLDERLRAAVEGSSVIAVSENPEHTLIERGIYATTLKDIVAVDHTLAASSAALVVAGLLFDQGIRWTAGKAETFTSAHVSDIPGITAYVSLAVANDTPAVFHGIGAGPLEVLDGRQLVKLMGKQGALFTPRDNETGDLIRSCGVPADQVIDGADTIFLTAGDAAEPPRDGTGRSAQPGSVAIALREYESTPVDFPARMARALDIVAAAHPDARFAFCILDPGDRSLAENVIAAAACKQQCFIQDYGNDLLALTAFLQSARAGFSMRYHSALVMSAAGIPCVGMDYLPKVASLYEDLHIANLLVPPTATAKQCAEALRSALESADTWRATLRDSVVPLQTASMHAFNRLLERIERVCLAKSGAIPAEFFPHTRPAPQRRAVGLEKSLAEAKADRDALKAECSKKNQEIADLKKLLEETPTPSKLSLHSVLGAVKRRLARS